MAKEAVKDTAKENEEDRKAAAREAMKPEDVKAKENEEQELADLQKRKADGEELNEADSARLAELSNPSVTPGGNRENVLTTNPGRVA